MDEKRLEELQKLLPLTDHSKSCPYWWDEDGVWSKIGKRATRLTFRPIIPVARGVDQDGELYLELLWIDPLGQERRIWLLDATARDAKELQQLPGSPADASKAREVARWIGLASAYINRDLSPLVNLCTRLGWIGLDYICPGHLQNRTWIGLPLEPPGSLGATKKAVRALASLPDGAGNLAMVALGLSAASPLVRFGCSRNPILGMAQTSSRGKSTALRFALSLWGKPERWSLQANSSPKGIEDKGITYPDSPILVEDLHVKAAQNPEIAMNILYFLGNGQRRTVASKDLEDTLGGQSRYGVSFYAAESEILSGALGGVQFRTWELDGDPMPNWETANIVADATIEGCGSVGPLLAEWYTKKAQGWRRVLNEDFCLGLSTAKTDKLNAGDIKAVRALCWGLMGLREVLNIREIDPIAISDWLIKRIATNRATVTDSVTASWEALITSVLGAKWGRDYHENGRIETQDEKYLFHGSEVVAERCFGEEPGTPMGANAWDGLYINTSSSFAARTRPKGTAERTIIKAWHERGLIVRGSPEHLKHHRKSGPGGRAVRVWIKVAPEQLARWVAPPDPSNTPAQVPWYAHGGPSPAPLQEHQQPPPPQTDLF